MIKATGSIPGLTTLPSFVPKGAGGSRRSLTYWKQITKEQKSLKYRSEMDDKSGRK